MGWKLNELTGLQQALILGGLLLAIWVFGRVSGNADRAAAERDAAKLEQERAAAETSRSAANAVDSCVARGVAYFKEIGSYPTLQSAPNAGRSAEEVARERCERTTTAF